MLTDTDRAMLDFAGRTFALRGVQEQAIRDTFDVTPVRFWQRVLALCESASALAYAPVTVKRLRRTTQAARRAA